MKKPDLIAACTAWGLDTTGTIFVLKERLKGFEEARGAAP